MALATVVHPALAPSRRILAVSDIHGNRAFFRGLLEKAAFSSRDILVLVGDILEKGPDSLGLLRDILELSQDHTILPVCGNCDGLVLRFFEDDLWDQGFFRVYLPAHPESILRQMAREAGFDRWDDLPRLRECLRRTFPWVWDWLRSLPTILESEHLVFVHGGVPSLDRMEELDAWHCMKNDDYWGQGHSFAHTGKYVVVGHWPVTLYDPRIPSAAPIIDRARHIISIDGGCVLKLDGQLNALIIPEESSPDFSWTAYDGLPTARALDPQAPSEDSLNIRWGRNRVEVLERGPELSLCRHLETGRVLPILTSYLYDSPEGLRCEDSTDYLLPVVPGDCLSIVARTGEMGTLVKKNGVTGWYQGRLNDETKRETQGT